MSFMFPQCTGANVQPGGVVRQSWIDPELIEQQVNQGAPQP
jgi:hypothetical protein